MADSLSASPWDSNDLSWCTMQYAVLNIWQIRGQLSSYLFIQLAVAGEGNGRQPLYLAFG